MKVIYDLSCPNCKGRNEYDRIYLGVPCSSCLPLSIEKIKELRRTCESDIEFRRRVYDMLKQYGTLKYYEDIVKFDEKINDFSRFFEKALGNRPWSAQLTWAKRVFKRKSFAILAPTGVGKTVFGILMSLYLAKSGQKCYIILPTTILVKQVLEKMVKFSSNLGLNVDIAYYYTGMKKAEKNEMMKKITEGNFSILITTSKFLSRNFEKIRENKLEFIFVDDVDALLKSSRNIDRVLMLLGFSQEIIGYALKIIELKMVIVKYLMRRKNVPPEISRELNELREKVEKYISSNSEKLGVLVVSTATGRVRGIRPRLFRELLGFDVGSRAELLRNIVDVYLKPKKGVTFDIVDSLVRQLGTGGLIFVPVDKGISYAEKLHEYLSSKGLKVGIVHAGKKEDLDKFINCEIDVLIGVAIYYGLLVRGIDLPQRVRYAIFVGVPRFKFTLSLEDTNPIRLMQIAMNIRDYLTEDLAKQIDVIIAKMRNVMIELPGEALQLLAEATEKGLQLRGKLLFLKNLSVKLQELLTYAFQNEEVLENIRQSPYLYLERRNSELYLYVPDTMTYLQASGRTSRMYAGGITKGLSLVIVDNDKLLNGLIRQTKWYSEEISWKSLDEINLEKILEEIDEDRKKVQLVLSGKVLDKKHEPVKTALLVVESPTKARTISGFYGKPSRKMVGEYLVYEVSTGNYILNIMATGGHIFDLVTKEGFHGVLKLNGEFIPIYTTIKKCLKCGAQYTDHEHCPVCKSKEAIDKISVVQSLRELAEEVDLILLGTDPDTEGEKIAWDIELSLRPYNSRIKRIEFHEVTKRAITHALNAPRSIDQRLVAAQLVRRIEDRWIGFVLSQKLWSEFKSRWLSAGRVQTPVLDWIVSRFEEAKESKKYVFLVTLDNDVTIVFDNLDIKDRNEAKNIRQQLIEKKICNIVLASVSEEKVNPPPPYSTDSMLKEASRILKVGVDEVMRLAQDLFEMGLITYHRTDSTRVSAVGRNIAREYITQEYGSNYFVGREWMKEGAHECIRPTRPFDASRIRELIMSGILRTARPLTKRHYILYDLIFRRFIASQMTPAKIKRGKYRITAGNLVKEIDGVVDIIEKGFTLSYNPFTILKLKEGKYGIKEVRYRKIITVPLYTQADIISLMKERGIGRPSTYAKILKTLLDRGYVLETKRKKLIPTKLGIKVLNFLKSKYEDLISEERTRIVERKMQMIEEGKADYREVLEDFYEEISKIAS
ncbi:MAG TPA: reverse gyrase [Thermoprotei archaeon]|nr:reverse gyrase [Thermoprotei archaeon]